MIKSMSKLETICWFLGFGVVFALFFYGVIPLFESLGLPGFYAYLLALTIPFILMIITTFYCLKKEGVPFNFKSLMNRLNYKKIEKKDILLLVGIFAVELIVFLLLNQLNMLLVEHVYIFPNQLPVFADPRVLDALEIIDLEIGLKNNYLLLFVVLVVLILNVVGEEIFWRGYLFERQKVNASKYFWVFHALMWTVFHFYKYYDLLIVLPMAFGLTYAVYKTKNNTPGLIFHFITNSTTFFALLYYACFA